MATLPIETVLDALDDGIVFRVMGYDHVIRTVRPYGHIELTHKGGTIGWLGDHPEYDTLIAKMGEYVNAHHTVTNTVYSDADMEQFLSLNREWCNWIMNLLYREV